MNSRITRLNKAAKQFFKTHKDALMDIILFGSLMRGKEKPSDIDVLLIFNNAVNKNIEYEFRNILSKIEKNVSIVSRTKADYKIPSFDAREGLLFEGYSIGGSKFVAEEFGFKSMGLFIYQTKNLSNAEKTRFYYAMNGRTNTKGFIAQSGSIRLSDNMLVFDLSAVEDAKEFFQEWHIDYKFVPILLPERLARKYLLERK